MTPAMLIAELRQKVGSDKNALPHYSDKQIVAFVTALLDIAEAAIAWDEADALGPSVNPRAIHDTAWTNLCEKKQALRAAIHKLTEAAK